MLEINNGLKRAILAKSPTLAAAIILWEISWTEVLKEASGEEHNFKANLKGTQCQKN